MTRRGVIGLSLATAVWLSGCAEQFPYRYRFRMTIEVETPQGLRSGSSVIEVWANNTSEFLPDARKRDWGTRGEAVAVDVAPGKTLFALLKTGAIHGDMAGLSMTALDPAFENDVVESAARIRRRQGLRSPAQVMPSNFPMLVTFRNIRDPKSVELVDPAALDKSFGPGVALKSITVEVTDAPVTAGIVKRLPWLSKFWDRMLDGSTINNSRALANNLASDSFSTEVKP